MTALLLCSELEILLTGIVVAAFIDLFKQLFGGTEEKKDRVCPLPSSRLSPATFE
jgi:hypothetical protein